MAKNSKRIGPATRAARTRAYNKAFDRNSFPERLGAKDVGNGLWRMPDGSFLSAHAGRPGKVMLILQEPDLNGGSRTRTFGVNDWENMQAFVNRKPTATEKRAAMTRAAPQLLEALKYVVEWYGDGSDELTRLDLGRIKDAIAEAEGESRE